MRTTRTLVILACLVGASLASATSAAWAAGGLTFIGMTPCRIVDTRLTSGFAGTYGPPALTPAPAFRTFQITDFTVGTPIQCGIPDNALAIQANFTVTNTATNGDLRVYPAAASAPLASLVNWETGQTIANSTSVGLGDVGGGHKGITVQADVSATDLIVDLLGYYVQTPIQIVVSDSGGTSTAATSVLGTLTGDLTAFGSTHTKGRLVARWNGQGTNFVTDCTATSTGTLDLFDVAAATVVVSMTRLCTAAVGMGLQLSDTFDLPSGARNYQVRSHSDLPGTNRVNWGSVELQLFE